VPDGKELLGVARADIDAAKEREGEEEDRKHIRQGERF
jgi:hypothetical protein